MADNIQKLITLIGKTNIAEDMLEEEGGEQELLRIGTEAMQGFDADWDSMTDWRDDVDTGLDLIKPETKARDEPWQGAANFKTPLIMEASLKFGDRATQELLKGGDLVKAKVVGKDIQNQKADQVDRVQEFMNWQLAVENKDWIEQQDKLLYDVSRQGTIFKKTSFDPELGHNVSEVIMFPNFAINQSTTTLGSALRFSHRLSNIGPNQIKEKQLSGVWLDIELELGARESDEDENEAPEDKITDFIEQQTFLDLDDDGYKEPYIVTFHVASRMPVRIIAQYDLDDINLMDNEGRSTTLDKLIRRDEQGNPVIEDGGIALVDPDKERNVVRITRMENLTLYGFVHDPEGKFLDVGWFHLLGSYASVINSTTNILLDSGGLSNLQGGWLAKGFRSKMGDMKTKPGAWNQTNISAQDLQQGIVPYAFKEPSATLLQLNAGIANEAQRLASTIDLAEVMGANTPAVTTLTLVQEQQQANGAIIGRIYRSMAHEFTIWFRLNATFIDPEQYQLILDDEKANFEKDFNTDDMDIAPAANPESSSRIQRIQTAAAGLEVIEVVERTQGISQPLVKEFLTAIGSKVVEEVYPELTPEQIKKAEKEQAEEKELAETERVINMESIQDLGESEVKKANARELEAQIKGAKAGREDELNSAKIKETLASARLKAEQAETEDTKNATNIVSAELNIAKDRREEQAAVRDRANDNTGQ